MRDDNSEWKQMQEEQQQWLSDPIAQAEYKEWSDKLNLKEQENEYEYEHQLNELRPTRTDRIKISNQA